MIFRVFLISLLCLAGEAPAPAEPRAWTNAQGKQIQAELQRDDLSPLERARLEDQLAEYQQVFTNMLENMSPEVVRELGDLMARAGSAAATCSCPR